MAMRWLSGVALVLGLALGVSVWMWQQAVARANAAEASLLQREQSVVQKQQTVTASESVEAALKRHEQSLVEKHRPTVVKLCQQFSIDRPVNAQTMDELMRPLVGLVAGLSK
jgi:uncharacterized protein HemX